MTYTINIYLAAFSYSLSVCFPILGQIELYTHIPVMRQFVDHLQNLNFRVCGVFIVDAQFMIEASKFVSGVMSALSAMVTLEIPHVNVMSKIDLLSKTSKKGLEKYVDYQSIKFN